MWYVGYLLLNREEIRSGLNLESDLDSDQYNDLLTVENKLEEFIQKGLISNDELNLLNLYLNMNVSAISKELDLSRPTIQKAFNSICRKIGISLGGMFTDDGYISYMQEKYKLTDEQVETLQRFITSNIRFKLAKKIYKGE